MTVRTREQERAIVVTVEGAVDGYTAPRLRAAVDAAFADSTPRPVIVDLSAVEFLGSPGLRILFDAAAEAVLQRGFQPLRIVVDHARPVIRPIEIVGLDGHLALYHYLEEALAV